MIYGPPSPLLNVLAKPLAENRSQDEMAVIKANNSEIFVPIFKRIHLIQLFYVKSKN